jgi:hypothetical protein
MGVAVKAGGEGERVKVGGTSVKVGEGMEMVGVVVGRDSKV